MTSTTTHAEGGTFAHVPHGIELEREPIGMFQHKRTMYQVYRVVEAYSPEIALVLIGPRDAVYAVYDHGPKWALAFSAISTAPKPGCRKGCRMSTPFDDRRVLRSELFPEGLPW